jgi:hypothetical protein
LNLKKARSKPHEPRAKELQVALMWKGLDSFRRSEKVSVLGTERARGREAGDRVREQWQRL